MWVQRSCHTLCHPRHSKECHLPSACSGSCSARKACSSAFERAAEQVPAPALPLCPAAQGSASASPHGSRVCPRAGAPRTAVNLPLARTAPRAGTAAALPAWPAPNQSSCRSDGAGADGGTFLCWVPALVEAFSSEWQPTGSWPGWQRSCRGSAGKSGRKAAPCGEWQESRPASRRLCLLGGSAAPGARPPRRRVPGFPSRSRGSC